MSLFEQILNTNLINFLIVIATLVMIFKKAHLGDIIENLANDIKARVEKSSTNTQNAISEYKTIKKQVKNTPALQEEIISNAKLNAQNLKEKIEQKTISSELELKSGLEKIYSAQNEKAKSTTLQEVYRACVDLAQDEVYKSLDIETHKKLINSSIEELDKVQKEALL